MSDIPVRGPSEKSKDSQKDVAEDQLVSFVNTQINRMREAIHLGAGRELSFYEINEALCTYQDTNLGLMVLYTTARTEHIRAEEAYESWFAEKYLEVREELNPRNLSAQKWLSQKEIEMAVRVRYKDEFTRYNREVIVTEQQVAFLRRLLEGWASHQYILTQLSKNLISEIKGLGIEDSLDANK